MTWLTFMRDFDFYPAARRGRVAVAYKAGMKINVTRECAKAAQAAGAVEQEKRCEDTQSGPLQAQTPAHA